MPARKKMPSVMKAGRQFQQAPMANINRSVFDRSHGHKTTFDSGLLVPVFLDEVLPGDTMTLRMTALARITTLLKPLMDNLYLESFFFFAPWRLIWTNFVKFMGEQLSPADSIAYTTPQTTNMPATGYGLGTIYDYMGLPTVGTPAVTVAIPYSSLPLRAYWITWNQWFRDENLQNGLAISLGDGPDVPGATETPKKRGKRADYFTSCLPFLQKGTAVVLPLGASAIVKTAAADAGPIGITDFATGDVRYMSSAGANLVKNADVAGEVNAMYADLSTATSATINDFRVAVGVQQFLERDARSGTRYKELIFGHFRVTSDDARLDRVEYLGGGSTPIMVSPIVQQTQTGLTGGTTKMGDLVGVGAAIASGHGFTKSFTEHGLILGIVNVRCDLTYSQGLERHWSRSTRYDHFWPILEELGEMAVLNKEIYATGAAADVLVFGYQERYGDYRYKPSKLTNLFRVSAAANLESWHLSEKFAALPTLGSTFIEDQTETILDTRVATPSEPDMTFDAFFDYRCARPMRVTGVPGLRRL